MGVVTTTTTTTTTAASKISLLCLCLLGVLSPSLTSASAADEELNKHVAIRDSVLLISTLDGSLHAVGQRTGLVKWTITDAPILQMSPTSPSSAFNFTTDHQNDQQSTSKQHLLLPDPKDGTLYLVNGFSEKKPKPLEKLPFTISELVSSSPCRSSDGMIYTSKKTDEWVVVDVTTGEKVDIINSDAPICPSTGSGGESSSSSSSRSGSSSSSLPNAFENSGKKNTEKQNSRNLLYLFKSEYTISVFNAETREKLSNFTFLDYSPSIVNSIPQNSYEYLHLTSSTNGKLATIDIANGENTFLWSSHFASPIVAMYKLSEAGTVKANGFPVLSRIPFLTIGGFVNVSNIQHNSLFPSVYIGELAASKSLYALSALVDYNLIRKDSDYLIEGPKEEGESNGKSSSSSSSSANNFFQMAGYYEFPKTTGVKFTRIRPAELIPAVPANVVTKEEKIEEKITVIQPLPQQQQLLPDNTNIVGSLASQLDIYTSWVINLFVVVVVLLLLLIVAFAIIAYKFVYQRGDKKTKSASSANGSASSSSGANVSIGKISYNVGDIIGRGCAGTCVYKGKFEGRQEVAVKRIVADCFQLANREIELLRRLQHPHLIRYFATETDHQFLYIAIELAELTLADSTLGYHFNRTDILHQSCLGLAHLHSLDIVHRDIKPANILISQPLSPSRRRKIMISDFGVSKILNSESLTTEFSAGTEGWIAPEILKAKMFGGGGGSGGPRSAKRANRNDIFSMGCLVYYTITGGDHPFGNLLSRQSNIINGTTDLEAIKEEEHAAVYSLVESMVAADPDSRPPIEAVVKHPFFWNAKQSLAFLQDISDRIESEKAADSPLVSALEYGSLDVCKGDWRRQLSVELQEDLRKFRNYKGSSVRDLLRAIRNKRHHYHELDQRLQAALGAIPGEFVTYFTSKFPRLIVHSYIAMQACRGEEVFQHYYHHLGGSEGSGNGEGGENGGSSSKSGFKWRPLPRTNIRWFDRYKEESSNKLTRSPETFVFDRRTIKIKTYNVQTGNGNAILTRAVDNNKGIPAAATSNNNSTNSGDQVSEEAETTAAAADLNQNHSKIE
ncbi:Serine/threonine-protein kinase/endoribonuclease IRE1 [Tyrophagus putrescentiae]|nr:Serine/threonine-protein kinase/endoribonuclease IRE1 [Tyrophagus putrescentiae]